MGILEEKITNILDSCLVSNSQIPDGSSLDAHSWSGHRSEHEFVNFNP